MTKRDGMEMVRVIQQERREWIGRYVDRLVTTQGRTQTRFLKENPDLSGTAYNYFRMAKGTKSTESTHNLIEDGLGWEHGVIGLYIDGEDAQLEHLKNSGKVVPDALLVQLQAERRAQ